MRKLISFILIPILLSWTIDGLFLSKVVGSEGVESIEFMDEYQYHYASFLFKEGKYISSAREFGRIIDLFPSSPYISEAQYRMAMAYFKGGLYQEAYEQFQLYLRNFPMEKYALDSIVKGRITFYLSKEIPFQLPPPVSDPFKSPQSEASKAESSKGEAIRAVQASIFKGNTYQEVEKEIKGLKEKGYDTLILRVFHNRGDRSYPFVSTPKVSGVYFDTDYAPVIEDILGRLTDVAHKHGLKLFAWMTTRYADYGIEGRSDLRCKAYDFRTQSLKYCRGLDLFSEEAVNHLVRLYQDLSAYPIDGILFQDDLVLKHNEGFGDAALELYLKEKGRTLSPVRLYTKVYPFENGKYMVRYSMEFWEWSDWKNKRLLNVAKRLMDAVREKNPRVRFAINLMYESISNPSGALAWFSQSLEGALTTGFDLYAVMAYHRQIQEELGLTYSDTIQYVTRMTRDAIERINPPSRVLMKVQLVDWETSEAIPPEEIDEILNGILKEGGVSIALFPYVESLPLKKFLASN